MNKAWLVYLYGEDEENDAEVPEFHIVHPGRYAGGRIVEIVYAVLDDEGELL